MARWKIGAGLVFAPLIALFALLVVLTLTGPSVPDHAEPVFDLAEIRELAGPGGPETLKAVKVSAGEQRGGFLALGSSWDLRQLPVYALELGWPERGSVLIEPSTDDVCAEPFLPAAYFDAAAYERMQQAMLRAEHIVATHEHFDHLCGLTSSPHLDKLRAAAKLTPGQLDGSAMMTAVHAEVRHLFEPLEYDRFHRLAPGVVLIAAPGHTTGSQWIYIHAASGAEWLLVGDSVWTHDAIDNLASKPWLPIVFGGEDGAAGVRYVRFLADLERDHPEVRILVAHEDPHWEMALASGDLQPL